MTGPETSVFISVSARPGRFGATVYGALFEHYNTNAVYLPRCAPKRASEVAGAVRALGIAGCSVSSPHKHGIIEHLDQIDDGAEQAQSVNTVVRLGDGSLRGYSTDVDGVVGALRGVEARSALIYGAGGVVGSTVAALRNLGVDRIALCARSDAKGSAVGRRFGLEPLPMDDAQRQAFDLLVNATPAGQTPESGEVLAGLLTRVGAVLDMPVSVRPTFVRQRATELGVEVRDGVEMCEHQIRTQASIYLDREVPIELVREIVRSKYLGAQA